MTKYSDAKFIQQYGYQETTFRRCDASRDIYSLPKQKHKTINMS